MQPHNNTSSATVPAHRSHEASRAPSPPDHCTVSVDDTDPSCLIADGQRVWFVEGPEPIDDRLLLTDERTGHHLVLNHSAWNSLISAVAYFQNAHCETCPNVYLDTPNDFVLIPGDD